MAKVLVAALAFCAAIPMAVSGGALALRAARNSQVIQNKRADRDDLSRMKNVAMVKRFAKAGLLVRVPSSTRHYYLHRVPHNYQYLRPWSKLFLERLSKQYFRKHNQRLRVTSMVRTVEYQNSLRLRNVNAAPAVGFFRSTHLTGATLDISKKFMKPEGVKWMRRVLQSLILKGFLSAVEEFRQPTFHIMVHRNYPKYVASLK